MLAIALYPSRYRYQPLQLLPPPGQQLSVDCLLLSGESSTRGREGGVGGSDTSTITIVVIIIAIGSAVTAATGSNYGMYAFGC